MIIFPLQIGILVWNKFTFWHPTPGSNSHRRSLGGSHHHTLHGFYEWLLVGWHQLEIARILLGVWMARKSGVVMCGMQLQLEGMTWLGIAWCYKILRKINQVQQTWWVARKYCVSTARSTAKWEPLSEVKIISAAHSSQGERCEAPVWCGHMGKTGLCVPENQGGSAHLDLV